MEISQLGTAGEIEKDASQKKRRRSRRGSSCSGASNLSCSPSNIKKQLSRRSSVSSNGKKQHSRRSSVSSKGGSPNPDGFHSKLKEYRCSNQGDSDDDERRQAIAPCIGIMIDDTTPQKEESKRGRRKERRNSRSGSRDGGGNLQTKRKSISLRRDSRSGARACSPAAFMQYQNNFNMADVSQFASK